MKYIRRNHKSNKIILQKYTKNSQHNTKVLTFLKSNYKYKRRCLQSTNIDKLFIQQNLSQRQQRRNLKQNSKGKQPKLFVTLNKQIVKRNLLYNNTKLEKFLRIIISIIQQAKLPTKTKNYINNKIVSNGLAIRFFGKMKTMKNSYTSLFLLYANENEIKKRHHAYKDANRATDNYIDISSNIVDEISHQQHNYDKVSTITSTPIKCQRRKHHQIKSTKKSISSLSSSSLSPIAPLTPSMSSTVMIASLSSPSMVVKTNYEIYQWPAILHNYICDSPSIHHQYHHKRKHNQHYHFHQEQHALHIKSLTSNKNNDSSSKSKSSSINSNKNSNSSFDNIDNPTCNRVSIVHQSDDQYVNTIWNRSYTLSCVLLTLFIVFAIGIRSTTAGACWQTVLDNGKCNEIFSLNISKSECCGANQEFAYTEREPTNVEYFFATAIGGGMECSPCLESCKNVKCGPNKKCVKRKGRPKCICAPECGAARRKRKQQENLMQQDQQHHTLHLINSSAKNISDTDNDDDDDDVTTATIQSTNAFKIKIDKSQQSRDTRSLSSEIANVNLGLENGKDEMMINGGSVTSQMVRHHSNNKEHNENQRKLIHRQMQRHLYPHNTKKPNDFQQYTHQIQHRQEHKLQLEQQQLKHKDQEPKDNRRLLITANVEQMEKPTTRRLQIFSNVRITHARRHKSKKNSNKNNNRSQHNQDEDTDPLDTDNDDDEEHEENNYNGAEENDDDETAKRKYSNSDSNNKNNNSRNDDATRFLNQSLPRHKLIKPSNNNGSNNNNKKRKVKLKKNQDLQTTKILQQHSSNNNTRIRHPQKNERQAEDTSHRRHHHNNNRHHRQQHHQQEQHQQHRNHHKHHQHRQNHHRHNSRQKHNKQPQQQQNVVIKKPKNNRNNGNATIAVLAPTILNAFDDKELASFTTLLQTKIVNTSSAILKITPLPNLSSPSSSSSLPSSEEVLSATTLIITPNEQSQSSSTMSSFIPSATPVNSTMSAINSITAANDHYRSHSPNHGSKIATSSSSQSPSSTSSSSSQQSTSPAARSTYESSFISSQYAKGEGVALYDHQHRSIQIPSSKNSNNNDNDDHLISTFNSNLHNNMLQKQQETFKQEQQQQQQDQQAQAHEQYFHSSLFDAISDQIDLTRFPNKQQHTITNTDNVRSLNPVCGTDGRTYNTECQLRKRACRTDNQNLQIAYRGHCKTTCNGVKCLNGLTCVEDQYSLPHCISCRIECLQDDYDNDVADATKAVCGADGKTYKSVCDINRMICKIGRSIGVAYLGPCREEQITCDDINCGPKQVCLIDLLTHKPRCTSCRYKCSRKRSPSFTHPEEGKICGANNHTYNSWCEMRKDSCSTGFYIDLKYSGICH